MGWGIGMGIGWPNASASSTPIELVFFEVRNFCDGLPHVRGTTQLIDPSIYSVGDYVFCPILLARVRLGDITPSQGGITWVVDGPVHTSCSL